VEKDIGRVPVVEGGNLVGIISRSDLLGLLYGGAVPRWHRTLYTGPGTLGSIGDGDVSLMLTRRAMEAAPPAVQALLRTAGAVAERMGLSVYAVGGLVRDLLLARSILDTDMVVEGDGLAFARELGAALNCQAVKEVPRFATAHIYIEAAAQGMPGRIDIATARREFYEHAAALPLVEYANLREDLYRRDFSINAMAIRLNAGGPGGLIDFFGGLQDLEDGHVRILHSLSFVEDPTRILRAVRFAHRYDFALEPETHECARSALAEGFLERVSSERLWHELVLLLTEPLSGGALDKLRELGALQRILPSVDWTDEDLSRLDRVEELRSVAPDLYAEATPWLTKMMLLLQPMGLPESTALIHRWKLRKEEESQLLLALTNWAMVLALLTTGPPTPSQALLHLRSWSPSGLLVLCTLGGSEGVLRYWREWRHLRLQINGSDLIATGIKPGPVIGRVLQRVLVDRLEGGAGDRETQLALALRYAQEED
jgi:tRNA nucleotidyltransferase (CCA-adding enzyme)